MSQPGRGDVVCERLVPVPVGHAVCPRVLVCDMDSTWDREFALYTYMYRAADSVQRLYNA